MNLTPPLIVQHYPSDWRRVFSHPAAFFFENGIAVAETKEIASLSGEPHKGSSFVISVFRIPTSQLECILRREGSYGFDVVRVFDLIEPDKVICEAIICTRSIDVEVLDRRGLRPHYEKWLEVPVVINISFCFAVSTFALLNPPLSPDGGLQVSWSSLVCFKISLQPLFGYTSIWDRFGADSGLLPCPVYCRHCVLATQRTGTPQVVQQSFLDQTFLADRITTLRQHMDSNPQIMKSQVPPQLIGRYSG
jgi:hypothetical protein